MPEVRRTEEADARLTRELLRRKCDQHHCSGPSCADRNHRRDVDYLYYLLDTLGLSPEVDRAG